jgi:hypothetical protein
LSWKALRLASKTDLNAFSKARKGDLPDLIMAIESKRAEQEGEQNVSADGDENGSMTNVAGAEEDTPAPEDTAAGTGELVVEEPVQDDTVAENASELQKVEAEGSIIENTSTDVDMQDVETAGEPDPSTSDNVKVEDAE